MEEKKNTAASAAAGSAQFHGDDRQQQDPCGVPRVGREERLSKHRRPLRTPGSLIIKEPFSGTPNGFPRGGVGCRLPHPDEEGQMTDYLLLYSGGKMPETEAEQADVMKAWGVWMENLGPALKDGGNPFTPQAKTIDPMGKVTEGPAGSPASGYSIIQANSLDEAVKMAQDCPVLQGGAKISVYETLEVM
jgi:hypothetical protein